MEPESVEPGGHCSCWPADKQQLAYVESLINERDKDMPQQAYLALQARCGSATECQKASGSPQGH